MQTLKQDVRYGMRVLSRSPGFTAVAVLTLALGIGANTAMFSVVQGVLLAPLPFHQPDRLMVVREYNQTHKYAVWVSYPNFLDWQRSAQSFERLAAVRWEDHNLTNPGAPERVRGELVSSGFFSTLGVRPAMGRDFSSDEDRHGGAVVAIISDQFWRDRFRGDPQVLGKTMTLDGSDYTIAGVLPGGLQSSGIDADVYTPLGQGDPILLNDRSIHAVLCIARLKPEVSIGQARAEMNTVQDGLDRLYPDVNRTIGTDITPLKQLLVGDVSGTLLLLLGAVGVVLLISCANVANLLLARSAARTREFAIRAALGANRARIVRQLLTESLLIAVAGGALGLVVAEWTFKAVLAAMPGSLPRSENIGVNAFVLFFAFGVSVAVGFFFGLLPALKSSQAGPQTSLKQGGRGATGAQHGTQNALVILQVALTLVLLVGAGLLFRTIHNLWDVDPGFDSRHLITFRVGLSPASFRTPEGMRTGYQRLVARIREVAGVEAVDIATPLPMSQENNQGPFWVGSDAPASNAEAPQAFYYWGGPDYLPAMHIPLLRGRYLRPQDTTKSEPVVVIDNVLARTWFPHVNPVGRMMMIPHWGVVRVVGVVGHVKHWGPGDQVRFTQNQIYACLYQLRDEWVWNFFQDAAVVVRTRTDDATVMTGIKEAVRAAGADQPVYGVRTMREMVAQTMVFQRLPMMLLGAFAGLALVLAAVGIYGVISYSVAQRVPEIGIRMALGAERRDILRMVIGRGVRLAAAGLTIGIVGAVGLARLLGSFSRLLYGVGADDPVTFVVLSLGLLGITVAVCYVPARRAAGVDPVRALRND